MITKVAAPAATNSTAPHSHTRAIVGASLAGVGAVGTGVAFAKGLHMPPIVAGGPAAAAVTTIGAPSLLNLGEDNTVWKSMAVGAAPVALAGAALGAFGSGWGDAGYKTARGGALGGTLIHGGLAAGISALTHAATDEHN